MKCSNCGNEVKKGAKFCDSCGQTIEVNDKPVAPVKKQFSWNKMIPFALVAVVVVLIIVIASRGKSQMSHLADSETIHLEDYIVVTEKGYNGYGSVEFGFDWTRIEEEHKNHITYTEEGEDLWGGECDATHYVADFVDIDRVVDSTNVDTEDDGNENLSNGDVVKYKISVEEEELSGQVICDLDYSESKIYTYSMSKLEELIEQDVFDKLKAEFSGISPWIKMYLTYDGEEDGIAGCFSCDKDEGLKNGDKVIVSLDDVESFKRRYGIDPIASEKEYTVQNQPQYIETIDQIDTTTMQEIKDLAKKYFDSVKEDWDENWDSNQELKDMKYIEACLLGGSEDYDFENRLYLIYKIEVTNIFEGQSKDLTYYWYAEFYDIHTKVDGNVDMDAMEENVSGPSWDEVVEVQIDSKNAGSDPECWKYVGFTDLDSLKSHIKDY